MKLIYLFTLLVLCVSCEEANKVKEVKERQVQLWSKVGLAWPLEGRNSAGQENNLWALAGNGWNKVSWLYTWSAWNVDAARLAQLEFVPMLWGRKTINEFTSARDSGVFNGCKAVLGFNEPDMVGQAQLSVADAVGLWRQYMEPLKARGLRLGAPSVASNSNGKNWLIQFFQQCTGCTIDFVPLHWYGSDQYAFTAYVQDMYNSFGRRPVWITEWACVGGNCGNQQYVYDFMGYTTWWLDEPAQSYVERFSWFGAMRNTGSYVPSTNRLLTPDGQGNTPLGVQFATGGHV